VIQGTASPEGWEQVLVTALLGVTRLLSLWTADARPTLVRAGALAAALLILASIRKPPTATSMREPFASPTLCWSSWFPPRSWSA
jgi:hypothetical protein